MIETLIDRKIVGFFCEKPSGIYFRSPNVPHYRALSTHTNHPMSLHVTLAPTPYPGATGTTHLGTPALLGLPGTANVPDLIRESALRLETYSPDLDRDLNDITFTDYGNLTFAAHNNEENSRIAGDACRAILGTEAIPFFLSRDSRYTSSTIRATADRYPEITALQLGARPNLLDEFEGSKWHARTAMKRALDRLPAQQIKHLGARCGTKEEFQFMAENDTMIEAQDLPELGKKGLYLSINLSVFDPYTAPGVNLPEPGGIRWEEFSQIASLIPWARVKACDLVGLEPSGDHTGLSHLVSAKVVRQVILALAQTNLS